MNTVHDEGPTDRPPSRLATVSPEPGTGLGAPTPRPLPDTSRRVLVMGIVNRTQDSFFDEGRTWELEQAVSAGLRAAEEGADIVDVGGVKFAPGDPLDPAEEAARVVPVIEQLRRELQGEVLLSVDTFHASVARAALEVGADLINDTTGLSDPRMAEEVARAGASLVLTHSVAEPRRPFPRPRYEDVVEEVRDFLAARLERALEAGIARERIVLDPGPDLNKSTQQTLEVLRDWGEYAALGLPLLAALSRKDFVGESLGLPKEERLAGSLAAAAWTIRLGARILRVHDVRETVRMVRMLEVLAGWREPAGPLVHNV
ncbi:MULTISPECIES: dihydropteroate synthase [Brachybacterium]|uniref:Dihydropteroate synthase n=2 Tax=Brachybacterium TaxID=43668 RepID=A0A3R8RPH2_9MICO|nr:MULTISPECIES: dihydropteroate synthase [Brachybacterium]RRR18529.1 dihydropteroate synthase [Brachybacterium paraconglomeratum]GLI30180.1 dihydropteroate synthase [Brachybacterium conglomeratum]GLK04718.1 dihydropteroate synthase [Brachybacterium conglomeratum]